MAWGKPAAPGTRTGASQGRASGNRGVPTIPVGDPVSGEPSIRGPPERRRWDGVGRTGGGWAGTAGKRRESADKPGSVVGNHPSGTHVAMRLERPTRKPLRAAGTSPEARALPYLVLLQVGFAVPPRVATGAVRSYRTLSPLPSAVPAAGAWPDDADPFLRERLRLGRSALCCTFRGLAPPRRYLAPRPLEPGLSSTSRDAAVAWPTPAPIIGDIHLFQRNR